MIAASMICRAQRARLRSSQRAARPESSRGDLLGAARTAGRLGIIEVALLAGISSQYYTKLERGNATGVSDSIIDGIADALQLDEAERTHLLDLIRTANTTRAPRRAAPQRIRPTVQRVLAR